MGGVQSVNEGPLGETFELFSACGPIVASENLDPSLYYLAPEIPGCPTSVCVKAGSLDFGPRWEQQIAIGLVWFTLISSIILWFYYTCVSLLAASFN